MQSSSPHMPDPLEELLYRRLIRSRLFTDTVRNIYCRVNNIPPPSRIGQSASQHAQKLASIENYRPTGLEKFRAYRRIFWEELKNAFLFRK